MRCSNVEIWPLSVLGLWHTSGDSDITTIYLHLWNYLKVILSVGFYHGTIYSHVGCKILSHTHLCSGNYWSFKLAGRLRIYSGDHTVAFEFYNAAYYYTTSQLCVHASGMHALASLVPRSLSEKLRRGLVTWPYNALSQRNSISHATTCYCLYTQSKIECVRSCMACVIGKY